MAIGSGLSAQIGMKKEATYGTRVVPDKFYEFMSEGGNRQPKYLESKQLRAGRFVQSGSRRVTTTHDAALTVGAEVPTKGFGAFLDLLHGQTVTPVVQGATTAYLQTHNWGTSDPNKSATIQCGRPDTGGNSTSGTVRPFDYTGSMVTNANFACAVDQFLTFNYTFDCQDEDTSQTLAVASYPTALEGFGFQMATATVNGVVQNLTTGSLVRSMNVDLAMPRATERYGLRSNALKAKPILNDYSPGTGALEFEFSDNTQYGLFQAGTKCPLILDFTSTTMAGTAFPFRFTMTFAQVQFTGATPQVSGNDILNYDAPFVILDDGTNPPGKIEYMSTDSTVL